MKPVISPIKPSDTGASVKDLQNALLSIAQQSGSAAMRKLLDSPKFVRNWTFEFNSSTYGDATEEAVRLFQKEQMKIKPTGKVNKATAGAINELLEGDKQKAPGSAAPGASVPGSSAPAASPGTMVNGGQPSGDPNTPPKVYGVVYDEWIEPLKGAPVMLFDKDIRNEHVLGKSETDEKGNYTIGYSREKLAVQGGGGVNLILKVYGNDGDPIYTSPVYYNAALQLQVNVNLGPRAFMGATDFSKQVQLIKPFIGELAIQDLTENKKIHDLSFLISKTGIAANTLIQLVAAFRFEKWTRLEAEVYYGILAGDKTFAPKQNDPAGLPTDVDGTIEQAYINFWRSPVSQMMDALKAAALNNTVRYKLLKRTEAIQAALQKLQTSPPQEQSSTQSLPPVYANISMAGLNSAQQQAFIDLYSSTGISPAFWTSLSQDKNFQGATAVVNKLQAVYQVAGWTAGNTSLTAGIVQQFYISGPRDIGKLVNNDVADWVTFINNSKTVPAGTDQAAIVQKLAGSIAAGVEHLYPTQVFAARFSKNTTLQLPNQDVIKEVVTHPAFDITKSIPAFLQQNPLPQGSDTNGITSQLLGMQRTHKTTGSADSTLTLLADNIQSARQVYAMGKANFVNKYSATIGADESAAVYEQASAIHAGATSLMGQLSSRVNNPKLKVMPDYGAQMKASKFQSDYPDLTNLFGMEGSYCECTNCESFLGIPAYLADLLDFLYERKTPTNGSIPNARAALLANNYNFTDGYGNFRWRRRPDIGDIDLNCDNANVELPYIDIVNELLEDYIIPPVAGIKVAMPAGKQGMVYLLYWLVYYLKEGTINPLLYKKIMQVVGGDPKTPICNISLLTDKAVVSKMFLADGENLPAWIGPPLISVNPFGQLFPEWIIRDQFITLKVNLVLGAWLDRKSDNDNNNYHSEVMEFPLDQDNVAKDAGVTESSHAYFNKLSDNQDYQPAATNEGKAYFELIIQEIHQTHLTTQEINANPEYTNTNVYNCLSDPFNDHGNNKWDLYQVSGGMIPISLPFDLYFTEANTYLQKIGVQRYSLIDTYRKQDGSSLDSTVIAYMGLSTGDADIIFTPRFTANINAGAASDPQLQFWGSQLLDGTGNVGVALFLKESGLSFRQLQNLLTVIFVNPADANQSYIADAGTAITDPNGRVGKTVYDPCNINELVIANVTSEKMDHIGRFIRLWRKLNVGTSISMHELDLCIDCTSIGKGLLDMAFAEQLYYFLRVMDQMSLNATQTIVLYQDIDTSAEQYEDTFVSLYQLLFQNRKISNPLVPSFTLPLKTTTLIADAAANPGAVPVILTACEITQADLTTILNLTNPAYTKLTLDNLSYIYACGLLTNALSISVAELFTFMQLTGITPVNPVDPVTLVRATTFRPVDSFNFIAKFNEVQKAGFSIDGINYLLTNQSTDTPSLVPDPTAVINGLSGIRTAIMAAVTATTPIDDPKGTLLKTWLADPDLNWDKNIAATLVSILATAGTAAYSATIRNNLRFLQLLQIQYPESGAAAYLGQLPSIRFPDAALAGISYDNTQCYLFYSGRMNPEQYNTLVTLLPADPALQGALTNLYAQSQECALSAAFWQAVPPAATPAWLAAAQQNVPEFAYGQGVLGFTGTMSGPDYLALLAQSNDAAFGCALTQLFVSTNAVGAGPSTFVQLATLPGIGLPDADAALLAYNLDPITNAPELSFTGAMSAADALALSGLSTGMSAADATHWRTAVTTLYTSAAAGKTVSVPFLTLPAGWNNLPGTFPDLSGVDALSFSPGTLSYSGTLTVANLSATLLPTNSTNAAYNNAVNLLLYNLGLQGGTVSVPLTALPTDAGFSFPILKGLVFSPPALCFKGQMNPYVQAALGNLSTASAWTTDVNALFTSSQSTLTATTVVPASATFAPSAGQLTTFGLTYVPATRTLGYTGVMSDHILALLLELPPAPDAAWTTAVNALYQNTLANLVTAVVLTLPGGLTIPAATGVTTAAASIPGASVLSIQAPISPTVQQQLLALNTDASYQAAIGYLVAQTSAIIPAVLPGIQLPLPDNNLATTAYTPGYILFTGIPNPDCMDEFNLQQLSVDPEYGNAIAWIYSTPAPAAGSGYVAAVLDSLPSITLPPALPISWANGQLSYLGKIQPADYNTLKALSTDPVYQSALAALNTATQIVLATETTLQTTVPLGSLPPIALPATVAYDPVNGVLYYTGNVQMTPALATTLTGLSTEPYYTAAVNRIANIAPVAAKYLVYAPAPAASFSGVALASGATSSITYVGGTLGFTGTMSFPDYLGLLAQSADPDYTDAVNNLYTGSGAAPYFPLPAMAIPSIYSSQLSFSAAGSSLTLRGYLSGADQAALLSFSTDPAYQSAIKTLYYDVSDTGLPAMPFSGLYESLLPMQFGELSAPAPAALYGFFLSQMSPAYQPIKEAEALATQIAGNFGISTAIATVLVAGLPDLTDAMTQASFATNNKPINPDPNQFPPALWYMKLARLAFLINQFNLAATDVDWLLKNAGLVGALDLQAYPSAANAIPFSAWEGIYNLRLFNHAYKPQTIADSSHPGETVTLSVYSMISGAFDLVAAISPLSFVPATSTTPSALVYKGQMDAVNLEALESLSDDAGWRADIQALYQNSQAPSVASAQFTLPQGITVAAILGTPGVTGITGSTDPVTGITVLSATVAVSAAVQTALQGISPDSTFQAAVLYLAAQTSAILPAVLPQTLQVPPPPINFSQGAIAFTGYPNPGRLLAQLVQLTGWNSDELRYLLNIGQTGAHLPLNPLLLHDSGTSMACAVDLFDISILLRLSACFAMAKQMRVVPSRCVTWAVDPITNNTAVDIKQALKSIYPDDASWMSAIVPIMNILRQDRRDALLAYLLSNPIRNVWSFPGEFSKFPDEYHVYGNFLIDIEMNSCQPTTRTIQAYCSIQVFVQRILMNIEAPGIVGDATADPDWLEWVWMGLFESWYEARYFFLFPENAILPQTLPNQSSFFQDMQNDIAQGPATPAIIQTAFGNYLESLDQVARLEVKGMWFDHPGGVLHVFARTYGGDPAVYYYRTLNSLYQWSPWEKVTADITGDQLIPVVNNGRLYVYWPIYTQATDDDKSSQQIPSSSSGGTASPPAKYWQIQMAFSEYRNGQWTGKKISKDYLSSQVILAGSGGPVIYPDKPDFVFVALDIPQSNSSVPECVESNNTMYIACYQSLPKTCTLTITVNWFNKNVYQWSEYHQQTLSNPLQPSFAVQDLINDLNSGATNADQLGNNGVVVDLLKGDAVGTTQNIINSLLSDDYGDWNIKVAFSYTFAGQDKLYLIDQGNYAGSDNAFLLDPLRGYCTATSLNALDYYATVINNDWFRNSDMINMLTVGQSLLVNSEGTTLLNSIPNGPYSNLMPFQMGLYAFNQYLLYGHVVDMSLLGLLMPFFYQDGSRTFFVDRLFLYNNRYFDYMNVIGNYKSPAGDGLEVEQYFTVAGDLTLDGGPDSYYQFFNFYHPYAHQFIKIYAKPSQGIEAILQRAIQLTGDPVYGGTAEVQNNLINQSQASFDFNNTYHPTSWCVNVDAAFGAPRDEMDFGAPYTLMGQLSSYGQYNWELFFHSVLLAGIQLSQNQQFAAADNCFKFIFNPTDTSNNPSPQKYWVTKPFFENTSSSVTIDQLILMYEMDPGANPALSLAFWESIALWRHDPYDPHMLAQLRLTPYMYATFMKYLDNLIAWADYNYRQYTMESVNIAIQLYMTALECLGPKPISIPRLGTPTLNYYQMELQLELLSLIEGPEGYLSDPVVQFENVLPPAVPNSGGPTSKKKMFTTPGLYFCIPPNPVLLAYWDTIETQLYKIRNCMNIAGQFQPLSPFPNVPGVGNMDGSGVADFGGVLPNYRFGPMIQKAIDLCNETKSLGAALLAALEKQDAEGLSLLHASQEITVQKNVDTLKQMAITDANLGYQNLLAYQTLVTDKQNYYSGLIQDGLLPLENQALSLSQSSLSREDGIVAATMVAGILHAIPQITLGVSGFGGSPIGCAGLGGQQLGGAADCVTQYLSYESHCDDKNATLDTVNAGYIRRAAEWAFQEQLATDELAQIAVQLQSAQEKIAIATQDEKNQQQVIQNAQDIQSFLQNKYTNQQLYSWMVTQISKVYFQSYQLAYSFAKQAEVCYGYELGITGASYISYGYWDSLHKGLLCGEALMNSLKKMETDYYANNVREYELTRQISLAQLDPAALLQLKANKTCFINIPEELFDLDYPGHYFRRVKHISVTIPGIVGPYTPVCLTMTLMNNSVRMVANPLETSNSYPRHRDSTGAPTNDSRFLDNYAAIQYIATSNGVNDSGLFEMNLHDERYLPFERAGAVSTWQLEFPSAYPQFDPQSITDLIIHFSYTSRDGGPAFQAAATASVQSKLSKAVLAPGLVLMRAFSARHDFPTQWYQFLNPVPGSSQQLTLDITQRFPFFTNGLTIKISEVVLVADIPVTASNNPNLYMSGTKLRNAPITFGPDPQYGSMQYSATPCKDTAGKWSILNSTNGTPATNPITNADITDLYVIFYYSLVKMN